MSVANRPQMRSYLEYMKAVGGVMHQTARGGVCVHLGGRADSYSPTAQSDQSDDDWYFAQIAELWPGGMPDCDNSKPWAVEA